MTGRDIRWGRVYVLVLLNLVLCVVLMRAFGRIFS